MKSVFVFIFVAVAVLDTCKSNVVTSEYKRLGDTREGYEFGFETDDGIKRDETGSLAPAEESEGVIVVRGSYSFVAPDGLLYKVDYIADENGYRTLQGAGGAPASAAVATAKAETIPETQAATAQVIAPKKPSLFALPKLK